MRPAPGSQPQSSEAGLPLAAPRAVAGARLGVLLQREGVLGYLLVLPALLLLAGLVAYPFAMALWLSLTDSVVGRLGRFVALGNFVSLFSTDEIFRQALRNSIVFTSTAVTIKTVLGISLALLLSQKLRMKRLFRGAVLLPWVIPTALSTLGWWWMFDSLYSVINWSLIHLGLIHERLQWLGTPHLAMAAVITVNIWRGLPFFAITILAGLMAINPELYEAAEADGAGAWARFWHITLPLLRPVLAVVILFSTILTFADFNIVYVLTRGGPVNSTHLFATLAYQVGLQAGRIGEGSAIALVMFPALAVIVYFQLHYARKEV
ncbi:MAG TPA: sugar ABC transporter permease [Methylomirabilota bacterium]|nr:sugar ABC transporter permease [Methylomirabilota bacterium]